MKSQPQSPSSVTPVSGWFLERVLALDIVAPGVAGHVLRASVERRQVIAAYLSLARPCSDFRSEAEIGWFLMRAPHGCILRAAFGSVPAGLRGALSRSGEEVQGRRYYRYLHLLLSRSTGGVADIIARLPMVTMTKLRIMHKLPPDLRVPGVIAEIDELRDAADLRLTMNLLEKWGVDRAALADALGQARDHDALSEVIRRWSLKVRLPRHPVSASAPYIPITTGEELRRASMRYRNCIRSYLPNILEERSAFALFRQDDEEAIVHLVQVTDGWRLDRAYAPSNRRPNAELRRAAAAYLREQGIEERGRPRTSRPLDALRRAMREGDPEGELEDW